MQEKKIIMYDAPECAREVSIVFNGKEIGTRYLSIDNVLCIDEQSARYHSHTHSQCECGGITKKGYTHCEKCIAKRRRDRYFKMPEKAWDGKEPLVIYGEDQYFWSDQDLIDYCEENAVCAHNLMLCICAPQYLHQIDSEVWQDVLSEDSDGELPKTVEDAMKYLNVAIELAGPMSWIEGKQRTSYQYTPESLSNQGETDERSVATDSKSE